MAAYGDLTHGMCLYAYLKIRKHHVEIIHCHCRTYIGIVCQCSSMLGSLQAHRGLCACRRHVSVLTRQVTFSKYGPSAHMTMPARRASTFCANKSSALPHMLFLGFISQVILGMIEPWPEGQPETNKHVNQNGWGTCSQGRGNLLAACGGASRGSNSPLPLRN